MSNDNKEQNMIAEIKRLLDADIPDHETRVALQKARIQALAGTEKRWQRNHWLEFGFAATLLAVIAINLPQPKSTVPTVPPSLVDNKPIAIVSTNTNTVQQVNKPKRTSSNLPSAAPIANQAESIDMDLLENLDLYQDSEFYEWLSEQEAQGVIDA